MTSNRAVLLGVAVTVAACEAPAERPSAAVGDPATALAASDTPPPFPRRGPGPGPHHPMDGVRPATLDDWTRHMSVMRGLSGHDLESMVDRHRVLAGQILDDLEFQWNRTARPSSPSRVALRDSLHRDLDMIRQLSPERLETFLYAHDARMRRFIRIHQVLQ